MTLNTLIVLNSIAFIAIIVPLAVLVNFLWEHHKENGPTQRFRYVILYLTLAKLFYFLMELVAVYFIFRTKLVFSVNIIMPIFIGSIVLASVNWYALAALRKLQR